MPQDHLISKSPRVMCAATAALLICTLLPSPARANDPVTEWNQHAVTLTVTPALSSVAQTRVMAIVQVAVHDAVNGITGKYATYLRRRWAPPHASPKAAAIAAAHHALRGLFPAQAAALDTQYLASLADHRVSKGDPGIIFGRDAAAAILAHRANDGSASAQFDYTAPGAGNPGVWVPLTTAPALLPGWGDVTPFVLRRASQFRPGPPPRLESRRYASDYNEVKDVGAAAGSTRTAEQEAIATFWRASPVLVWNNVLVQVLGMREQSLSARARTFALFYLASADASIACWEAKYTYNFWRPQPAIVNADLDDNEATISDAGWLPLFTTPPHPEYPSGNPANSGAFAYVLERLFGRPATPLVVTVGNITREWKTFGDAVSEVIDGRVYSGFHFRTSDEVGARQGRQVAKFVMSRALRPCRWGGHSAHCR
jgi:hypothetical protein